MLVVHLLLWRLEFVLKHVAGCEILLPILISRSKLLFNVLVVPHELVTATYLVPIVTHVLFHLFHLMLLGLKIIRELLLLTHDLSQIQCQRIPLLLRLLPARGNQLMPRDP